MKALLLAVNPKIELRSPMTNKCVLKMNNWMLKQQQLHDVVLARLTCRDSTQVLSVPLNLHVPQMFDWIGTWGVWRPGPNHGLFCHVSRAIP